MYILKITVEHNLDSRGDIYFKGPFQTELDARIQSVLFHGELDAVEIIELVAPSKGLGE
jgi:hypothetical protein